MNIKFTAYQRTTGQVLFSGTADDPATVVNGDTAVLIGEVYNGGWLGGDNFDQHFDVPAQPSGAYVFDWTTKQWYDPRTLQDLKDEHWTLMKLARAAAIDAPLPTPYGVFDSDASARTSITDAVLMLQKVGPAGTIDFTLADNTVVTLTTAQMVQVGLLLGQKVQQAYTIARARRTQIEAATTPAEVEAVTWE